MNREKVFGNISKIKPEILALQMPFSLTRTCIWVHYVNSALVNELFWVCLQSIRRPLPCSLVRESWRNNCRTVLDMKLVFIEFLLKRIKVFLPLKLGIKSRTGSDLNAFAPRVDKVRYKMLYLEKESKQRYNNFGW